MLKITIVTLCALHKFPVNYVTTAIVLAGGVKMMYLDYCNVMRTPGQWFIVSSLA